MTKQLTAEFVGTFTLVLLGCGAIVLAGFGVVGQEGVAFAFGLAVVAMAYGLGPVAERHLNPAVSFAAWVAGRMHTGAMLGYWIVQCLGAVVAAGILLLIASGSPDFNFADGLGQNGYGVKLPVSGQGSPGDYSLLACAIFEVVATFIFVSVFLGATQESARTPLAGLAIGLTLVVIHIVGIQVTGVSVNPARSLGPAVWMLGDALGQLWLFIAAPMVGAGLAGCAFRAKLLSADES